MCANARGNLGDNKMADGTISITTEGGQQFSQHFYSYMDTGRANLKVIFGVLGGLSCLCYVCMKERSV